ncbi:Ig-like domain-containing protein [Peribacillus simplex]|uniref:Ig-like domain-containing protein n=1 Tax=Peribacillus simplex TaxID=1478 RepID=UPI0011A94FF5|nr:Ig-like domain-containing protein [Peribacillus simplex]
MKKIIITLLATNLFTSIAATPSSFVKAEDTSSVVAPAKQELTYLQKKELLTKKAIENDIPPEILKGIATTESNMKQFDINGNPLITGDGGMGIMQITDSVKELENMLQENVDVEKIKYDTAYNIEIGAKVLNAKRNYGHIPRINNGNSHILENWYFAIIAYNGLSKLNDPNLSYKTYQDQVWKNILKYSLADMKQLPLFTVEYSNANNPNLMVFPMDNRQYNWPNLNTPSTQSYQKGDIVYTYNPEKVTSNLRNGTEGDIKADLPHFTPLEIVDGPYEKSGYWNQYTMYQVKGNGVSGYIASSNIRKANITDMPIVNTVNNKATTVTGITEKNATVSVTIGTKVYKSNAGAYGTYKVAIPVQNASTSITVTAKDAAGKVSAARKITVTRVAPNSPIVNTVNNKATTVAGKTEKSATVTVTIGTKVYTAKADAYGTYKVVIPVQNASTSISVTAKDAAGKVSAARKITVTRVAPNSPIVNTVNNKATTVTGKTEKSATVTVTIGTKIYTAKADAYGTYKVVIPVQNASTTITVTAKDAAGKVSAARKISVTKVAPNMPTVNPVKYYTTTLTGKTEKYAKVTVKIGTKIYSAKANAYGTYKVNIPKQKVGTKIFINATDSKGRVSVTKSITVS